MSRFPISDAAALAGIGLIAGLVGSLAMLASQKAEITITGRKPSPTPARAIERLGGPQPQDQAQEQQISTLGHFAFGTSLGLGLAVLEAVPEPARTATFFAGAWGAGTTLITETGASDPPTRWEPAKLAVDLAHHAVYAVSAGLAFLGLRRLLRI